jgi:hypothetical protein
MKRRKKKKSMIAALTLIVCSFFWVHYAYDGYDFDLSDVVSPPLFYYAHLYVFF